MAAIIIPFSPVYDTLDSVKRPHIELFTHAAWEFARCALWPDQHLSFEEIEDAKAYIREYFKAATGKKRPFTALCQRVVLTQKYLRKSPSRYVPKPSVWFNRRYPFGFAGTLPWLYRVEQQRKLVPGYLAHIEALADGYYEYAMKPTKKAYKRCRQELGHYHATTLIELLDATVNAKKYNRA